MPVSLDLRQAGASRPAPWVRTLWLWLLFTSLLAGLAGCAQPPRSTQPQASHWSGRLAVQVNGQTAQSFSASFELQGSADQGELTLYTPLGNVLALLQWQPGQATLRSGAQTQTAPSLDELLQQATGAPIPVTALFDWLAGRHASAEGWRADLNRLDEGLFVAQRDSPEPRATLRIALDR